MIKEITKAVKDYFCVKNKTQNSTINNICSSTWNKQNINQTPGWHVTAHTTSYSSNTINNQKIPEVETENEIPYEQLSSKEKIKVLMKKMGYNTT